VTVLRVYRDDDPTVVEEHTDFEAIARVAAEANLRFERWAAEASLPEGRTQEQVLAAYRDAVRKLSEERGFATADVISMSPETPNHPEMRKKFLFEHTHTEDEARFFVEGRGVFYIHAGSRLLTFTCEQGDLINVPAGTRHWFDMGPNPRFTVIRLFTDQSGWVAHATGSDIASRFPRFEG
jgi:1,2-dihydroxy-3-keto-5-methylthiopentene dioxygenase